MGVFNFLKRFSKEKEEIKEIKLDELNGFIDSCSKKIIDGIKLRLGGINEKINLEKKKSKENLHVLKNAELRNKNIPERVKQIMDGNRETYIQKVDMLIEKVNLPENLDDIAGYCDSFDMDLEFFGKNTLKSYRILQEFFGDEVSAVAENIRDIGKFVNSSKSILKDAKMGKINELKNEIKETEQKIMKKVELKDNIQSRTNELRKLKNKIHINTDEINKIEKGIEYRKIIGLINRKKVLKQNVLELEKELWHSFSVIEPALKKYERMTLEKELTGKYLTTPLNSLLNDEELKIVKLLEKMKNAVIDKKIELKEKKRDKILNELDRLNTYYFKGFLKRDGEMKNELNELKSVIEESTIIKEVEKMKKKVDAYKDKIELTNNEIEDMTKEFEEIDIKELKKKLEKIVFASIDKNIAIL